MPVSVLSVSSQPGTVVTPKGEWAVKLPGGYRRISTMQLAMAAWLYRDGRITRRQWCVWWAANEMSERREYTRKAPGGERRAPRYSLAEIHALVGGPRTEAAKSRLTSDVKALGRLGLVKISEKAIVFAVSPDQLAVDDLTGFWEFFGHLPNQRRRVTVPRRTIRAMAGGLRPTMMVLVTALLIRTLFWHRSGGAAGEGGFRLDGRTKLSWVAAVFGVGRRALTDARKQLLDAGVLLDLPAEQWEQNRWGTRYVWALTAFAPSESPTDGLPAGGRSATPLDAERAESAPPCLNITPPCGGSINNNPAPTGSESAGGGRDERWPTLKNIRRADLVDPHRTSALYELAVKGGVAGGSEGGRLKFFALAHRALAQGAAPERLFAWLLRRDDSELLLSAADEEAAANTIRYLSNGPRSASKPPAVCGAASNGSEVRSEVQPGLSRDARFVSIVGEIARKQGVTPFDIARKLRRDLSRSGWVAMQVEYRREAKGIRRRIGGQSGAGRRRCRHPDRRFSRCCLW